MNSEIAVCNNTLPFQELQCSVLSLLVNHLSSNQ